MPEGSWDSWGAHVLKELERLNQNVEGFRAEQSRVWVEIAALRVKAGLWGLVGGALAVIPTLIFFWLER